MEADVIAFGIDSPHFRSRDADELAAMRDPQFFEPFAVTAFGIAAPRQCTGHGAFQPLGLDRLEHVIDRLEIESLDRIIVMRGDEYDRWPVRFPGQRLGYRDSVHLGHGHVEQHQIGLERPDQAQRLRPVAGGADHLQRVDLGADNLHPFDRQRFVIDDKRAQFVVGFVSHVSPSVSSARFRIRSAMVRTRSWRHSRTGPRSGPAHWQGRYRSRDGRRCRVRRR